ncbi:MAG: FAD-binding protein [Lachnospiraceae bacterium]|nr:FAD-binding protein [Lachnospiraceae bacterium]
MKEVLIIGSGISGLTCAVRCAGLGMHATLISPVSSERAQSVMAAGGINAVTAECEEGDSVACHIEDTLKGGGMIAGRNAVTGLCGHAEEIIHFLEGTGTVFTVDDNGRPVVRAFGGQSHKRTHYCGSSTGKQIVSALIMEARRFEGEGLIDRKLRMYFHSALIKDGECYGAILYDEKSRSLLPVFADAVVIASGGQNALFGKTTGTTLCDGYAAGKLFLQGAELKNLEFIQYHPTTLETAQKRMLISEAVRGEGGRLFYEDNGKRIYFMEDIYGPKGNLMTRDVVSREIDRIGKDVFLDISFLDKKLIDKKIPEVRDLCMKYRGIDISKEPIPVSPSVHFFMGGLAVHLNHETNIRNLYAAGECASMYHGANRLGGNSLLAAIYSGNTAADDISGRVKENGHPDFSRTLKEEQDSLNGLLSSKSSFSVMHIRDMLSDTMRKNMSIVRSGITLKEGMDDIDYYLSVADQIHFDSSESIYTNYSLPAILTLARAAVTCALSRHESRGSHYRSDYPETKDDLAYATLISYDNGAYTTRPDKEKIYEN